MKPMYSDILKELRKDKKLTQRDMGKLMGISQASYCGYENGVRRMPLAMLCFLADVLDTSTDYSLGRTEEIRPYPKRTGTSEQQKRRLSAVRKIKEE